MIGYGTWPHWESQREYCGMLSTNKTGDLYCFFIILTANWSTYKTGDLYSLTAFLLT